MQSQGTDPHQSKTAHIRALAKVDSAAAVEVLHSFLKEVLGLAVQDVEINYDQYSLNSLNGFFSIGSEKFFFKFHQEDGEEDMKGEYYRAELLSDVGLPIDLPVYKSVQPGEQVLVYRRRTEPRFSDVLRDQDVKNDPKTILSAAQAEANLNAEILRVAHETLHKVSFEEVQNEPIHHLFYDRLSDPQTGISPGGRYTQFYVEQTFELPGCSLSWGEFATARLVLNGQEMAQTFGEIFECAMVRLKPGNLVNSGGFTAHGDAHNANVWFSSDLDEPKLTYFDPAFAGEHIPSLLAEIKATFHNVFAHPFWLYDPAIAQQQYTASACYEAGVLRIDTDWCLSNVRQQLLDVKAASFWKPFLERLSNEGMLPDGWREIMRSAFAMCPALVMNLRANQGQHNKTSSAIGFYVTALVGSEPLVGANITTDFFDRIQMTRS